MNIGIFIHECYEEFDIENCISEFTEDRLLQPLPSNYQLFFVFQNSSLLLQAVQIKQAIAVFDLHNHPPIDILVVAQQSFYNQSPDSQTQKWLVKNSQSAQLLIAMFSACRLLDELSLFTDLKILKTGLKPFKPSTNNKLLPRTNSRWQSQFVVQLKHSLPEAILNTLHLLHKLESAELVHHNTKQLQFDL